MALSPREPAFAKSRAEIVGRHLRRRKKPSMVFAIACSVRFVEREPRLWLTVFRRRVGPMEFEVP